MRSIKWGVSTSINRSYAMARKIKKAGVKSHLLQTSIIVKVPPIEGLPLFDAFSYSAFILVPGFQSATWQSYIDKR